MIQLTKCQKLALIERLVGYGMSREHATKLVLETYK